jgi:hypothetical protein
VSKASQLGFQQEKGSETAAVDTEGDAWSKKVVTRQRAVSRSSRSTAAAAKAVGKRNSGTHSSLSPLAEEPAAQSANRQKSKQPSLKAEKTSSGNRFGFISRLTSKGRK